MHDQKRWNYVDAVEAELRPHGWFYTERGSWLRDGVQEAYADGDWSLTEARCAENTGTPPSSGIPSETDAQMALRAFFEWFFSDKKS